MTSPSQYENMRSSVSGMNRFFDSSHESEVLKALKGFVRWSNMKGLIQSYLAAKKLRGVGTTVIFNEIHLE